jgi:hypothetical protein
MPTGLDRLLADALSQQHIGVEEMLEELREKRVPVCSHRLLDARENGAVKALRIVRRLLLANPSAESGVSHMPSWKAKKLGKLPQEKVLLEP